MRFRKLRIAWSVGWGFAAVLLIVLWVRSINHSDTFRAELVGVRGFEVWSNLQQFGWFTYPLENKRPISLSLQLSSGTDRCHPADNSNGFKVSCSGGYAAIVLPHWLFALAAAIFPLRIWLCNSHRFRFSLRTLLIATTLVAVVLGLVAAVVHTR